ncbi:MAG: rod shape-determining protein RodA [Flavobacteriaceae bacterium]|nr:MAG: rod shape-determining protein RodA [Flavobacteriaceae bacterium]
MRAARNNIFYSIDWTLVLIYILLVGFGWVNIYAVSPENTGSIFNFSTIHGKQLLWIILSIPLIIVILFFNFKFYEKFAGFFYLASVILLIGLFLFGKNVNGAVSWYDVGIASIQPSEFSKAFTALALAKLMHDRNYNLGIIENQIKAFFIIFLPAFLIFLQPDAGSALIYLSFFFVLNREGLTLAYLIIGISAIVLFIFTLIITPFILASVLFSLITLFILYAVYKNKRFLKFHWIKIMGFYSIIGLFIFSSDFIYNNVFEQHHRDRFDILLGKKSDTQKIGYNSNQSIRTISSGGFSGKGFLKGDKTQGGFVPEQHTDYIFSVIGEEWGFIGSSMVIILFLILLYRILFLAETHNNKFGRIYGYGVASILFFHILINIGMVIGLLPTIGIPLPFFSYGGSSLWGFTLLLFIFIKLDAHKNYDW